MESAIHIFKTTMIRNGNKWRDKTIAQQYANEEMITNEVIKQ